MINILLYVYNYIPLKKRIYLFKGIHLCGKKLFKKSKYKNK